MHTYSMIFKFSARFPLFLVQVLLSASAALAVAGCGPVEPNLDCSALSFRNNVVVTEEDAVYDALLACFNDEDAGVKAFGGVAYDVGFHPNGAAQCVKIYKDELLPRSAAEQVQECQMNILQDAVADECENCGTLRGYGFLLCFDRFGQDDCSDFVAQTQNE